MRTIERDIAAAIIFSRDGKILLGRGDPATSVYPNCWVIPGGGVEEGETHLDALRREVVEETGIDIAAYPTELIDDTKTGESEKTLKETGERVIAKMRYFDYRVTILDRDAADLPSEPTEELLEVAWVDVRDLLNYQLTPPSIELFKKLGYI